jgi:hypothetical protein
LRDVAPTRVKPAEGEAVVPLSPSEQAVLEVLRDRADWSTWVAGEDGGWAIVMLDDAKKDMVLGRLEFAESFGGVLNILSTKGLYTKIHATSGWVRMDAAAAMLPVASRRST